MLEKQRKSDANILTKINTKISNIFASNSVPQMSINEHFFTRNSLDDKYINHQRLLSEIKNWLNDGKPNNDQFENVESGTKTVFLMKDYPKFIFKLVDEKTLNTYQKTKEKALDIINKNNIKMLKVPNYAGFLLDNLPYHALLIEEKLPIKNTNNFHQAKLFSEYGETLNLAIKELIKFIFLSNGLGDLHRSNLLILDSSNENGDYYFGLIDVDHLGKGIKGSLIGYSDNGYNLTDDLGLLRFISTEHIDIIEQQAKEFYGEEEGEERLKNWGYYEAKQEHSNRVEFEKLRDNFYLTNRGKSLPEFENLSLSDLSLEPSEPNEEYLSFIKRQIIRCLKDPIKMPFAPHFSGLLYFPWSRFDTGESKLVLDALKENGYIFDFILRHQGNKFYPFTKILF
ncbi:MAG: hypothetical protein KC505_10815 [Myxococcales bacterium]|nr:hypothetical protein [Myxococcales bacterium]USN51542.1 MAG: hypothetical protein H6731_03805 [Myxococcales bacterium]